MATKYARKKIAIIDGICTVCASIKVPKSYAVQESDTRNDAMKYECRQHKTHF